MINTDKSLNYTCIFGGGAVRGVAYIGAIKALEEIGISPNNIAGSSVGAVFSALLAVGYTAEELKEIFTHVNYELFRDIHFGIGKDFAISKGEIFLDWLRELIEQKFYGKDYKKNENSPVTFKDLKKNLVIITTDLSNFKCKEFSKMETPDFEVAYAVRISSTMPGLMKPVEYEHALLVDGDLQKSWPMWRLSKHLCPDCERILEFRLEGEFEEKGKNAISFMNTVYSCVTSLATDFIIDTYGDRDKFDYIRINTGSVVIVNFNLTQEEREELIEIGYAQTMQYFQHSLIDKKKEIIKEYRVLSKHLRKMEKFILANKIKAAQIELGTVYMELCRAKKIIDLRFYNAINDFKDTFLECLIPAALFGMCSLKHSREIKFKIKQLNRDIEEKIMELESYIFKL